MTIIKLWSTGTGAAGDSTMPGILGAAIISNLNLTAGFDHAVLRSLIFLKSINAGIRSALHLRRARRAHPVRGKGHAYHTQHNEGYEPSFSLTRADSRP